MKGGAVTHLLHGSGYNDLDFFMYKLPGYGRLARSDLTDVHTRIIIRAADTLQQVASQSVVVVNPAVTTIFLRFSDNSTTYIQFVDTLKQSKAEQAKQIKEKQAKATKQSQASKTKQEKQAKQAKRAKQAKQTKSVHV